MLVFNLLEILFSWCYWDGQLPGPGGHTAGDSALRTGLVEGGAWAGSPIPCPSRGPGFLVARRASPGQDF